MAPGVRVDQVKIATKPIGIARPGFSENYFAGIRPCAHKIKSCYSRRYPKINKRSDRNASDIISEAKRRRGKISLRSEKHFLVQQILRGKSRIIISIGRHPQISVCVKINPERIP